LAPMARMPNPDPLNQLTYAKRAKDAKRAKGITNRAAFTAWSAARDVTCATQRTLTGSSK
jgi:hypothetical protein